MDDYEIKDYKLLGSVSSIKSSLFDITSLLNVKILDLDEEIKKDNDPRKIKIKEELNTRLKNIIDLSDSFYGEIIEIDKNFEGIDNEVTLENNDIKVDSITEETEEEINEDLSTPEETVQDEEIPAMVEDNIDDEDDTIEISDKAIDDLMNIDGKDEDDITEVDLEDKVEEEQDEPTEEESQEEVEEPVEEEKPQEEIEKESEETPQEEIEESVEEEKVEESTEEVQEEPTTEVEEPVEEEPQKEVEESTETPVIEEKSEDDTDKAIAEQKENVTKKEISYIINKDNIDPAKAILVTSLQYDKLLLSRDEQKTLCKLRKYMIMPGEKEKQEMNLEEMLSKAESLYKEGKTSEAEELYNKISDLNRK